MTAPSINVVPAGGAAIASTTTTIGKLISAVPQDDIIVVAVNAETTSGSFSVSSVTATGLTFAQRSSNYVTGANGGTSKQGTEIWWAHVPSGGFTGTATATFSTTIDDATFHILSVTGADTSSPWNGASATTAGNGTFTSSAVETTFSAPSGALAILAAGTAASGGFTAPVSGFTNLNTGTNGGASNHENSVVATKTLASALSGATVGWTDTDICWTLIADAMVAPGTRVTGVAAAATITGVAGTVTASSSVSVTGVAAAATITGVAGTVTAAFSTSVTGIAAQPTITGATGFIRAAAPGVFSHPLVGVQLDLAGSAFGSAFTGTDVTPSAVAGFEFAPITVAWGRQDQYGQVQPTAVTGLFRNVTGDLTPGRTASPYYPHIRRGLHRRISILANFINIPISDDFATTLTVDPSDPTLWTTDVEGSDLLTRYSGTPSSGNPNQRIAGTTLRSFIVEEMLLDAPIALYLFQENEGATTFSDVTGTHGVGTIHDSTVAPGFVDAGQEPIPPANGLPATWYGGTFTQVTNPDYLTWQSGDAGGSWIGVPLHTPNSGGNATACTFELWVSTFPKKPANYAVIVNGHTSFSIWIAHDGTVNFGDTTSTPPVPWATGPHIADGAVHQVAISWNGTSTLTAYVDGASVGTSAVSSALDSTPMNMGFGPDFSAPLIGGVAYWAMYGRVLPAPRINSHYHAGSDAFVGESTDRRITRLLSYRPNYGSVLDAGTVTMGVQDIQGRSLADCLLEVGVTEGGAVFVDGLGKVNFRARSRLVSPTVTVTLNCLAGDVQIGGSFRDDTQNVLNDVTVSTPSGSDQRYYNAASITADGEFSTSVSVPLQTDAQALALATWMVTNGVQENLTFDTLTVNLLSCSAATAAAVLALAPLDIVSVTNIDVNATRAPNTTMTFVVQGGQLSLGMDAMTAVLNVTPMPA